MNDFPKTKLVIELEPGVWRADWSVGDPPRTTCLFYARLYNSPTAARIGLAWCRRYRSFAGAKMYRVPVADGHRRQHAHATAEELGQARKESYPE